MLLVDTLDVGNVSLTYGGYFLAVCVAAHLLLRYRLPNADPYLFPLVALLAAIGLVVLFRINEELALEQATLFLIGILAFAATIILLRDYTVLERYRYLIGTLGIVLLLLPRLPGIGAQANGAYLGVALGPINFQPSELAKICIVIFLASYLREKREVLIVGARRILGVTLPPLKHFGPLLVVWGASMLMLVFTRDLGSSLMFFGAFLAVLYVATNRLSFVVIGSGHVRGRRLLHGRRRRPRRRSVRHLARHLRLRQRCRRQGLRPDRAVAVRAGRRRTVRPRPRAGGPRVAWAVCDGLRPHRVPRVQQHRSGAAHRLHLRGHRQRARALRRLRRHLHLRAARGARIQDGDAGPGRLFEAARHGPDGRDRPAGVRDHRRCRQGDSADGCDLTLRQLRRKLGRREHDPGRAADARLRSRSQRRRGGGTRP